MRIRLDDQLERLNHELVGMGVLCESAIATAAKALLDGDMSLAREAIALEKDIDQMEREIENLCLKILLQQQPVAKDLRLVSAALKMITDMERIGDQAADIAEIVQMGNITIPNHFLNIGEMSKATIHMVTESINAFVHRNLQLAQDVIDYDDVVDGYFETLKMELIELIAADKKNGEYALDILMIAKYFERIGDHATNIAEWVAFSITGKHEKEGTL